MFSSVSAWILSIAGIISLSVVVELILPEGSLNKYIRSVFSFIVVLVIIAPLPKLVSGKAFDFDNLNYSETYEIDDNYIYQNNIYKTQAIQDTIMSQIKQSGYEGVEVSVSSNNFSKEFKIKAIYVEMKNLVILDKAKHKNILDIQEELLSIILRNAAVKEEEVIFER